MEHLRYLEFDLVIERTQDGYRARVVQSPAGEASVEFSLPFSDQDIEVLMLRVGRARRGVRRLESSEMQAAKQFGGKLFDTVFAGEVRGALRASLDAANMQGAGLRVRLRLSGAPEMVDLPWEFLYNSSLNRFLALSGRTPLVRYIDLAQAAHPYKLTLPLRVLVMISNPSDSDSFDAEREWKILNDALRELVESRTILVERLADGTLSALRRRLRQGEYHVLHFIGHGMFDPQIQDGVLLLEDEQGRARHASGQYIATVLNDHDALRLVVLYACEGARTARKDPFAGVAQSLVQQGMQAVVEMQFETTDEASHTFAREFYAGLADGYSIDAALTEARGAVFSEISDLEWGTPALYLRTPDGMIFEPPTETERAVAAQARAEQQSRAQAELRVRDPKHAEVAARVSDGRRALDAENLSEARAQAATALTLDAGNADAEALLRDVTRMESLAVLYARAQAQISMQQWREARATLSELQAQHPDYRDTDALMQRVEYALDAPRFAPSPIPPTAYSVPATIPPRERQSPPAPLSLNGISMRYALPIAVAIIVLLITISGLLALTIFAPKSPTEIAGVGSDRVSAPAQTETARALTPSIQERSDEEGTGTAAAATDQSGFERETATALANATQTAKVDATLTAGAIATQTSVAAQTGTTVAGAQTATASWSQTETARAQSNEATGTAVARTAEASVRQTQTEIARQQTAIAIAAETATTAARQTADAAARMTQTAIAILTRNAIPPPPSGQIAFQSKRAGHAEVFIMNADGSNVRQLTSSSGEDRLPAWSPNGARIAFESYRSGGNGDVYTISVNGGGEQNVTASSTDDGAPTWSPDGGTIAFQSDRDGNYQIYAIPAGGGTPVRLTNNGAWDGPPSWSRANGLIAFESGRDGNAEVYVMNGDGSNQRRLTNHGADDLHPTWSPDGTQIAFYSHRDGNAEIYVMGANGSNLRNLTHNGSQDVEPTWSPDGRYIAFASTRDGNFEIYVMDTDGENVQRITFDGAEDRAPAWSP